ncbi:MAG: hypothetical protein V3V40_06390 [Nitrosomonadaceae bacterium]
MLSEDSSEQAISTTKADEVEDIGNVVNINKDKLAKVEDKVITGACASMEDIDKARSELNAKAGEIRARLNNLGIPSTAFNAAYARYKLGAEKRAENDAAFAKCCNAMDIGYQSDLF